MGYFNIQNKWLLYCRNWSVISIWTECLCSSLSLVKWVECLVCYVTQKPQLVRQESSDWFCVLRKILSLLTIFVLMEYLRALQVNDWWRCVTIAAKYNILFWSRQYWWIYHEMKCSSYKQQYKINDSFLKYKYTIFSHDLFFISENYPRVRKEKIVSRVFSFQINELCLVGIYFWLCGKKNNKMCDFIVFWHKY